MIRVEDITVTYGENKVLNHYSLDIEEGKTICVMGDSGIGKSTLLKVLMGLVSIEEGHIDGLNEKKISAVFQEDRLCEQLTALKNVMMVLEGRKKRDIAAYHLSKLLEEDTLNQQVINLSGGMKRRVGIARAFAYDSDLILMDEPFTGLDEDTKMRTIEYMLEMKGQRTIIFVTHDSMDAKRMHADHVIQLSRK